MNLNVAGETMVRTNAASTPVQVSRLALFVAASVEGHTVFVGYRKPWKAIPAADRARTGSGCGAVTNLYFSIVCVNRTILLAPPGDRSTEADRAKNELRPRGTGTGLCPRLPGTAGIHP